MRKLFFLLFFVFSVTYSQVPQGMSHRGTAYNSSGTILQNADISIRVRILEGNGGTAAYIETHAVHTNNNGQYSFNIGQGTNPSTLFNTIDWSTGNKWLEIGIDPNNGTNYTVIGSSQLMSVPYALFSKNTLNNNGIEIVNNVNFLINNVIPSDNKLVYVKGYFSEGDGGEGFFIFKKNNEKPTNLGTIFSSSVMQSDNTTTGRWIRQYSGFMNVSYFGVQRDWKSTGDYTNSERIQNMIDYATTDANTVYSSEADLTIYFPNGQYFIDKPLILKDRVKLLGSPGTLLTNKGDVYDYMFKLNSGPVTNFRMENFLINLNNQPNVGGIHIKGIFPGTGYQRGGLWNGNFKNINIQSAKGNGIYLEGSESTTATSPSSNWNLPNQFIIFENVRVQEKQAEYFALKMTGQNANYTFLNCEFNGNADSPVNGGCIYIGSVNSEDSSYTDRIGSDAISFINSGIGGYSKYGAIIRDSGNITFDSCFFEGLDFAFDIKNSEQISVLRSRFANAAGCGTISSSHTNNVGRIFTIENSIVNIRENRVAVTETSYYPKLVNQQFILGVGNNNVINIKDNSFKFPELGNCVGVIQTVPVISNKISLWSKKFIFINVPTTYNASTSDVKIISSDINHGETIFLRANGGTLKFLPMPGNVPVAGSNNIYLNGRTSLTLTNGQGATFIKIDNGGISTPPTYQLVSVAN